MPKLSDLSTLTAVSVSDPRAIRLLTTDEQGTPTSLALTVNEMAKVSQHMVLEQTGHGLVAGDEGKPLVGLTLLNDVTYNVYPTWVLVSYIDANTVVVAPLGALVEFPTYLLAEGASHDVATDGYDLYWDTSTGKYTGTRPSGSAGQIGFILTIVDVNVAATTFTAIVRVCSTPDGADSKIHRVVGTGSSAVDDVTMAAAVARANATGDGSVLMLVGKVQIANNYSLTASISIVGEKGTNPELEVVDDGGIIDWNGSYSPISSGTSIPITVAKQSWLPVPPGTLAVGDWFLAMADDTIEGVTHSEGPISTTTRTVTADAATDVFTTSSAHGYTVGDTVTITTTNTLPGGLSATTYWIAEVGTTTTFKVSASSGGAVVDITSAGTGTHTVERAAIAEPVSDVITREGHGFRDNDAVNFRCTGTMPGGLSQNTTYWVVNKTTDTFKVAATRAGTAIDITSAGTGALTVRTIYANCPLEVHKVKEIRGSAPTVVVTSIAADTFTSNGHGYVNGQIVNFTTTGTLPTGITSGTHYYIVNKATNTFQVSTTSGGSAASASGGSGTLTCNGYDYVTFDDYIVDALTVNPRVLVVTSPFTNIEIADFTMSWTGSTWGEAPIFNMRKCFGVNIHDMVWAHNGPNSIFVLYCGDVLWHDNIINNVASYTTGDGYVLVAGPVNRLLATNSVVRGCRHVFTTSAQIYQGARYGTPRNVKMSNIKAGMTGKETSTLVMFDTHAEGWGIVFEAIEVVVLYEPRDETLAVKNNNRVFQSRSRHTIIRNCLIDGNDITNGVYIQGKDCRVEYCTIIDCWRGIHVRQDNSGAVTSGISGTRIAFNTFEDCRGPGVISDFGDDLHINQNVFTNCGQFADAPVTKCSIYLANGTSYCVSKNVLNRDSNTLAIGGLGITAANFTRLTGNDMVGYFGVAGATDSGFDSTNADAVALQALADAYNVTD